MIKVTAPMMRDVVTVQSRTTAPNANNEPVATWGDVMPIRAVVKPTGGSELWRGMKVESETTHVVTVRYWAALEPSMRLIFGGKTLQIDSVHDLEGMRRFMVLQCREQRGT